MIVPMAKVQVLGPAARLEDTLRFLQERRVLEVRTAPPGTALAPAPPRGPDLAPLEKRDARAAALLAALPQVAARPSASASAPAPSALDAACDAWLDALEARLAAIAASRRALEEERAVAGRYAEVAPIFASLRKRVVGLTDPETIGILLRRDRPAARELLEKELARITRSRFRMATEPIGDERIAALIAVPRESVGEVSRLLFEQGVSELALPKGYEAQPPLEVIRLLLSRLREIPRALGALDRDVDAIAAEARGPLVRARAEIADARERRAATGRVEESRLAFVIFGWIPEAELPRLTTATDEAFGGAVAVSRWPIDPRDLEQVPVLLRNGPGIRPFERLLSLVALPRYGGVDPTPYVAVFYPVFFGGILGDVGMGALLLVASIAVRVSRRATPFLRDVAAIGIACGASAMLFGIVYGEMFGDLWLRLGLPRLVDRGAEAMTVLGCALALGLAHVMLGLALGAAALFRAGLARHAVAKLGVLLGLAGAGLSVAALPMIGVVPVAVAQIAGAAGALGVIAAVATGGLDGVLEAIRTGGAVLSYARLMALGLAGVLLADVANRMPSLLPAGFGISLAIFLHAVNFAIGVFSPAIQSMRLHYVEFFDTFFEGGGRRYRPLSSVRMAEA